MFQDTDIQIPFLNAETPLRKIVMQHFNQIILGICMIFKNPSFHILFKTTVSDKLLKRCCFTAIVNDLSF